MKKWFRRSLMAVGATFIVFLLGMLVAMGTIGEEAYTSTIGALILLFSMLFSIIALVSGAGTAFQWLGNRSSEKAKRGMVYEDEMLNRIMNRLDDEERGYLQGYLASQSYEPYEAVQGFDYIAEEKSQSNYE